MPNRIKSNRFNEKLTNRNQLVEMLSIMEAMLIKPILHQVYEVMLMLEKRIVLINRRSVIIQYLHEEQQHRPCEKNHIRIGPSLKHLTLTWKNHRLSRKRKIRFLSLVKEISLPHDLLESHFWFLLRQYRSLSNIISRSFPFQNILLQSLDAFWMPSWSSLAFWSRPWISNPIDTNESIWFLSNQVIATYMSALACLRLMSLVGSVYFNEKTHMEV